MTAATLGEVLRGARLSKGLTLTALALKLSGVAGEPIDPAYISKVERSETRRPGKERLKMLADLLHLDAKDLYKLADYSMEGLEEVVRLPVGDVAAGPGVWTDETFFYGKGEPVPPERVGVFRVRGISMEPDVPEGSILHLDREASARPGDIVVAWTEQGGVIKRLAKEGDTFYLQGNSGPAIPLTEDVTIAGVVFFIGKYV